MAIYTVHVPSRTRDTTEAADKTRFLREGFSGAAFLFGPLWLIWSRLWLELFFFAVFAGLVALAQQIWGLDALAGSALMVLANLFLGLEGAAMRAARLDRRHFERRDIVAGTRIDDIERRFFARQAVTTQAPAPGDGG